MEKEIFIHEWDKIRKYILDQHQKHQSSGWSSHILSMIEIIDFAHQNNVPVLPGNDLS